MNNRRRQRKKFVAEINITPFTDVILVLLIIFMITTPLISQSSIKVDLPEAKNQGASGKGRKIQAEIVITREGLVYLNDKLVTSGELKEQIRTMRNNDSDLTVTVRSDKFVRFQEIVSVLDPLAELGITKLNIAASNRE